MKIPAPSRRAAVAITISLALTSGGLTASTAVPAWAATVPMLDLRVLLIGNGSTDPTTAAWESALTTEGVPYTEVDATGTSPAQTVTLPALSSATGTTGNFDGVVIADSPTDFATGALTALYSYESTFRVNQVDGYMFPDPSLGVTEVTGGAADGTTATLTPAGLAAFPALAGPIPFATGTYGYGATVDAGAPYTTLMTNAGGQTMAGIYQHPSTDAQAGVPELSLYFNYNSAQLQWLLLAPGLINWVTQGSHLGLDRNYVEMDIDDTFTPDNAWSTTVHDNDYSDADSQRMDPADVVTAADWSNPTQELTSTARPAGAPATAFRLDQLFNWGGSIEYQDGMLDLPGEPTCTGTLDAAGTCGPDPLLAEFQATDPATGKPYADDFGWLSHTYDTPYLDVGCATTDYIEAELNENTADSTAAPGATPGTGGLGLTKQSIAAGATDVANPYGTYNPQVFVPGNHSGFADLDPGTPATVDPPDLDKADAATTGGTLASGTYEYAVTDQFNGADSTSTDQSQAYVTDGLQGDVAPVAVAGPDGSVSLTWQAICHAANYIIYRSAAPYTSWTEIGTYATPDSATLPDNSSGDTNPAQTSTVCTGGTLPAPTSCAGEQELTFTDTGATSGTASGGITYVNVPMPSGWAPPVVEDANELPWEQNPNFTPALQAVGITTVGADASKAYPDPADDTFGIGVNYTGATYAAGQPFVEDGSSGSGYSYQVAPRHPINIFYNVATNAQELDEYNTLYTSVAPDSQCHDSATTTCSSTLYTFADVINQVVTGMLQNMLSNNPEVTYVHQTNLMGAPPYSSILPPANYVPAATAAAGTDGDGTLYEVLNPLISEYDSYFNSSTPYVQLTLGGIGSTLADQAAWSAELAQATPTVSASETNGVVTVTNTGTGAVNVPVTVPPGTTSTASLQAYGGELSNWVDLAAGESVTFTQSVAPSITSAASATSNMGASFSFTVSTTGEPAPALTESGALPSGLTFTDNGNGTATIAGTPATGSGGTYPLTIKAANAAGSATQSFVLTNTSAPSITSPATATFTTGFLGTYDITTTGFPAPTLTDTAGTLPSGLTFTDNDNGTGTISGTPATGTPGSYTVPISATNASGSTATLDLALTVNPATAPVLSTPVADFTLGTMGSVVVTATGYPTPSITETGALPAGLSFIDNGNGTALLSGTPTTTGTSNLTLTAANGVSPNATETLSVIVGQAPAFTSADSASATVGSAFTFTVTTGGYPAPSIGASGLPSGFTFIDNGNGTATISGTPTAAQVGAYAVAFNGVSVAGSASQTLSLTVALAATPVLPVLPVATPVASPTVGTVPPTTAPTTTPPVTSGRRAPAFTSASTVTASVAHRFAFTVSATGEPVPTLAHSLLPKGLSWASHGNGQATIAGVPQAKAAGTMKVQLKASSAAGSATQVLVIRVLRRPGLSAGSLPAAAVGRPYRFTLHTYGYPTPRVTESGALPAGLSFRGNASGEIKVSGTPAPGSSGDHHIRITVSNSMGKVTVKYTLAVKQPST